MFIKNRFHFFAFISFSIIFFSTFALRAQFFKCTDSSVINNTYCDTAWAPICGCDNRTYHDICDAYNHNGIINYTDRTCEDITLVHFYPIPVTNIVNYRIYTKVKGSEAFVYIYDMFAKSYYFKYFQYMDDHTEILDLSTLPNGMYVMIAVANGHFSAKKFVKIPYY